MSETGSTRRVEAGGLAFNVLDVGEGPEVLLLLHGFPDSHRLWRNQVPALVGAGYRVVAPDQRGFGESDKPGGSAATRWGGWWATPRASSTLGVEGATVVGHDWGAAVAWALAMGMPERVRSLVAVSVGHPACFMTPPLAQLQKSWYMLFFQFAGITEEILRRDDWRIFRAMFGEGDVDQYVADLSRPGALTAGLNWYRANMPPEVLLGPAIPFPPVAARTLGIWSDRDFALTEKQMTRSERYVSGGFQYERIEGVGHWVPLAAPERLNSLLVEFLAGP